MWRKWRRDKRNVENGAVAWRERHGVKMAAQSYDIWRRNESESSSWRNVKIDISGQYESNEKRRRI